MSPKSKKEYMVEIRTRYHQAKKNEKGSILDEFCAVCNYNRKYAIRKLNCKTRHKDTNKPEQRGRKPKYSDPEILKILTRIWIITNLPCSKRLKVILKLWLPYYPYYISPDNYQVLLQISPATIDRLMKPARAKHTKRGLATTKPGALLKKRIPIKTNQWDETRPGFIEADTVAHCGSSTEGMFVYTINCVDIATSWTEQRAVWGKGERGVLKEIDNIEFTLPFPLLGFDCDNGSEFLNWHLYRYFVDRKNPISFTRARSYHKNDNAHVEEKNWTHVRQYLGYLRFDKIELVGLLNDLYTTEWRLYFNFFYPSVKLVEKYRNGSHIIKKYDQPKTPFQRLLESNSVSSHTKAELREFFKSLNPFDLQKRMSLKIKKIQRTAIKK